MKKIIAFLLVAMLALSMLASCDPGNTGDNDGGNADDVKVMTYAEFAAAEIDSAVVVEAYIQAKQSWWFDTEDNTGKGTFYTQAEDGAYFVYEMPCTEEQYNKLTVGSKIRVSGTKAEWSGEVEIIDATFEILSGNYIAPALDATALLASNDLVKHQNKKVGFYGMTVEASNDDGAAYLYKWNGSGSEGDDLYFKASVGGNTYTFVIESYLTGKDSDVYKAVKALKVGDVINMEGFLYWYDGAQPHITSVDRVMSHAEFDAAELDATVTVNTYIQAKQSWWFDAEDNTGKGTFYTQAADGAYFVYEMPCTEEEYNALTVGTAVAITGIKAEWSGEVEIIEATYTIINGSYVADALDATELLASEDLIKHQNEKVSFKGMTVVASNDDGAAYLYKWNGSGSEGDDLYFKASVGGNTYTFVIESYLTNKDSDVYKAVKALNVGDVIDMEGFLYWYDGAQPHITSVTKK